MKVMRIITRMNVGGPALHVIVLTEGLREKGYETILAAGSCEENAGDAPASIPPGLQIEKLDALSPSISPLRDLAAIWSAFRMIRRERPDIVHTHTAKAGLVGRIAARLACAPTIVHTFHGNSLSGYFSPAASAAFRRIEQLLARITDRICVVSEQQFHELSNVFRIGAPEQFVIMPLGLDLFAELRLPPPAYNGVLTVGWLGRMVNVKRVGLLADVIDEAFRRDLRIRFMVAGDGPDRRLIRSAVARHGPDRLQWAGWQKNVCGFLSKCDVLMQTSRNEGTPVALIQGMAAARPFISTRAGGVVDLAGEPAAAVEPGGCWFSNGVLVDADAGAFVEALGRFQATPSLLPEMGLSARSFAGRRFRAERLTEDMDRMYKDLLRSRRPAVAAKVCASARS